MNHAQRMRYMKASWLQHFTNKGGQPRRRQLGEHITDAELKAMCLKREDVQVAAPEPAKPETILPPPPPEPVEAVPANLALLLGYHPVE